MKTQEFLSLLQAHLDKALDILNEVPGMRAFDPTSEIKIEYVIKNFHTTQFIIGDHIKQGSRLVISLAATSTDFKAKVDCGIPSVISKVAAAMVCCNTRSGYC